MNNFEFNREINVNEIASSGYGRVTCKVTGYWSSDVITLYISRNFGDGWKVTLTHSSGGRDPKVVESDLDAEINFGQALIAMANFGKEIEARFDEFEAAFQAERIARREQEQRERDEQNARIEADLPLGETNAVVKIESLTNLNEFMAYIRGSDRANKITCVTMGNRTYYVNGNRVSKKEAIRIASESSARSEIC